MFVKILIVVGCIVLIRTVKLYTIYSSYNLTDFKRVLTGTANKITIKWLLFIV